MKLSLCRRLLMRCFRKLRVRTDMAGCPKAIQWTEIAGRGVVRFGSRVRIGWKPSPMLRTTEGYFEARTRESVIDIGDCCIFNNGATIIAVKSVSIGSRFVCGVGFKCYDSDFHGMSVNDRNNPSAIAVAPVVIGEDCWCGDNVLVLKGVELGRGCVVGAGSVVTKSFPDHSLIAGNPARLVRLIGNG